MAAQKSSASRKLLKLGPYRLNSIYCRNALTALKRLPDNSIDCVVTSPPYWALRDYGVKATRWPDGMTAQLGLEPSLHNYIKHLCDIFDEVRRILKDTGTCWVNIADTYAAAGGATRPDPKVSSKAAFPATKNRAASRNSAATDDGIRSTCLCMIPSRFAIEMVRRGWILRNDIVWHKPNRMPTSVKNRLGCSWEHVFLFAKKNGYYFDLDAIRVPHTSKPKHAGSTAPTPRISVTPTGSRRPPRGTEKGAYHPLGKNPGDCWSIHTRPTPGAHFATFPEALCERPIHAGCPRGGIVLDPFIGSGTTVVVARRLGRAFLGFDAKKEYVRLARDRLGRHRR